MNTGLFGLPGNGKGVMGATMIVEELRLGKRPIITNFATEKLPWVTKHHEPRIGLRSYLLKTYDDDFDCRERIFRVSDMAMQNFYLYRALNRKQVEKLGAAHLVGYRQVLPTDGIMSDAEFRLHQDYQLYVCDHELKTDKHGRGHCDQFNAVLLEHSGPHLNLADECWKFWPARGWQSTSEADVYYNAQHRHFGDDNVYLTQRHNDIDSIIVDRCQECILMTHHGKLSFGIFRQPNVFRVAIYNGRPMPSKEPMSTRIIRPDVKGLLQTYDTSAGIGISGRGAADTKERKKGGLPFWSMPLIVLAVLFAIGYGIKGGASYAVGLVNGKKHEKANSAKLSGPAKTTAENTNRHRPSENSDAVPVERPEEISTGETGRLVCRGYFIAGGNAVAFLSDGSTVDAAGGLEKIERSRIKVAGAWLPLVSARNHYESAEAATIPAEHTKPVVSRIAYADENFENNVFNSQPPAPVNEAIILPAIHNQGGLPPPRLNGISTMEKNSSAGQFSSAQLR